MASDREGAELRPWIVTASRHVLRDRWISVRADACVTDEGVVVAPYYVLEYPDWVIVVAIDREDNLILVEQYRHAWGVVSLELPTGGIEPFDQDPIAAGKRELAEETGLGDGTWTHVGTLAPNPSNQANKCLIMLARDVTPIATPTNDPTERIRLARRSIDSVVRTVLEGGIVQSMHVAALALALTSIGRWQAG